MIARGAYRHRWLIGALCSVFLLSLISLIPVVFEGGGWSVTGGGYVDDMYVALAREVADGHSFAGNPFYFEHRDEIPVTFILPYWLYAAPMIAGLPVGAAVEFNFTLWSLLFALPLFFIFKKFGLPSWWSAIGTIAVYMVMYGQLLRPISMELVHPALLLFFLAYLSWWERPDIRRAALLTVATVFSLYAYTFLAQLIGAFLTLAFAHLLISRDRARVKSALCIGATTAILGIPFLLLSYAQLHHPAYFETMVRTALAYTHIPAGEAFRTACTVFLFLALGYVLHIFVLKDQVRLHTARILSFCLLGMAIIFVSFANVVSGLDVETASHAARFVPLWLGIGFVTSAYYLFAARKKILALPVKRVVFLMACAILVLVLCAPCLHISFEVFNFKKSRENIREVLAAQPVMRWLDARESEPKVIWTSQGNPSLWGYITIYTKHYILSDDSGNLQLVSNDETEERYLIATAANEPQPTLENIAAHVWEYNGVGAAHDTPNTINRGVKICRMLRLYRLGYKCGELTDSRTLYAEHYEEMYERYRKDIVPNLQEKLQKYHVAYIMKDKLRDTDFRPERLPFIERVYDDGRYEIYEVQ